MTTIYLATNELDDMMWREGTYSKVDKTFIDKHRWYNSFYVIFRDTVNDKLYSVYYMEPASEMQEDQDRWNVEYKGDHKGLVKCQEVKAVEKKIVTVEYVPVEDDD